MRRVKIEIRVGQMFSGTAALGYSCRPNAQAYQGGRQIGWFGRTDCYLRRVGDLPENVQPDHVRSLENALTQSLGRWLLLLNYKHSRGGRGLKVKVCLRPTGLGPKAKLSAVLLGEGECGHWPARRQFLSTSWRNAASRHALRVGS